MVWTGFVGKLACRYPCPSDSDWAVARYSPSSWNCPEMRGWIAVAARTAMITATTAVPSTPIRVAGVASGLGRIGVSLRIAGLIASR